MFDASLRRPRYSLWKVQVTKLLSIARSEDTVAMFQYQTFAFSFTAYINIPTDKKVPMKNKISEGVIGVEILISEFPERTHVSKWETTIPYYIQPPSINAIGLGLQRMLTEMFDDGQLCLVPNSGRP